MLNSLPKVTQRVGGSAWLCAQAARTLPRRPSRRLCLVGVLGRRPGDKAPGWSVGVRRDLSCTARMRYCAHPSETIASGSEIVSLVLL